ncbi:MAG: hypothetical protein V4724_39355 [Pseudomonadota bacterium]
MELFNKSGVLVAAVLVTVGVLIGVQAKEDMVPPAPVIEATALQLNQTGSFAAERRLREWADQGSAVARRELALLYQGNAARRAEAIQLFEEAARAGDSAAAAHLAALHRAAHSADLSSLKETIAASNRY